MTTYAITSVTGRFGRVAVKELAQLVPATDIVALARNTEKAAVLVRDCPGGRLYPTGRTGAVIARSG